jgi:hypothetical protein
MINAIPQPSKALLSPAGHTSILIDFQSRSQAKSIDPGTCRTVLTEAAEDGY